MSCVLSRTIFFGFAQTAIVLRSLILNKTALFNHGDGYLDNDYDQELYLGVMLNQLLMVIMVNIDKLIQIWCKVL